jgi:hypothetical protein
MIANLVFIGPKGGRLRRSNFRKFWHQARDAVGMPELHFHDIRHTGNTMAAAQGASLKELMERMGHSSSRAALIYQHATRERDKKIAAGMGKEFAKARKEGSDTQRACKPRKGKQQCSKYAAHLVGRRRESNPHDQLEGCRLRSDHTAYLALQRSASDRETPLITVVNGTLMARRSDAGRWRPLGVRHKLSVGQGTINPAN